LTSKAADLRYLSLLHTTTKDDDMQLHYQVLGSHMPFQSTQQTAVKSKTDQMLISMRYRQWKISKNSDTQIAIATTTV